MTATTRRGLFGLLAGAVAAPYAKLIPSAPAATALTIAEMPRHDHGFTSSPHSHGITDPAHSHSFTWPAPPIGFIAIYGGAITPVGWADSQKVYLGPHERAAGLRYIERVA